MWAYFNRRCKEFISSIKFFGKTTIKQDKSNNFNNNFNNMEDNNLIIDKGHYQLKSSLGSEKPTIINIIGQQKGNSNYWITRDGEKIPEYILQENYVRLETRANETIISKENEVKNILFRDFEFIEVPEIEVTETTNFPSSSNEIQNFPNIPNYPLNTQNLEIFNILDAFESLHKEIAELKNPQPSHIENKLNIPPKENENISSDNKLILQKIYIPYLNDQEEIKYGSIQKNRKQKIQITIDLPCDFDLNKLSGIIDLFEIPIDTCIDYIYNSTFNNPDNVRQLKYNILKAIKNHYNKINNSTITGDENYVYNDLNNELHNDGNKNHIGIDNENHNGIGNKIQNSIDNSIDNENHNGIDNKIQNSIDNENHNTVDDIQSYIDDFLDKLDDNLDDEDIDYLSDIDLDDEDIDFINGLD
jgi:hypothetical protein